MQGVSEGRTDFISGIGVIIQQTNHFRVTRALRPMFLLDAYYARGVRR